MAKFWFAQKQVISSGVISQAANRPLTQNELGVLLVAWQNDAVLTEHFVLTPFRISNIYASEIERIAAAELFTSNEENAVFFQSNDETFWVYNVATGFTSYVPVLAGGGGVTPPPATNQLIVDISYDEVPTKYPITSVVMYISGIDQQSVVWDGSGGVTKTLSLSTEGLGGIAGDDGELFIVGKNGTNDVWVYSIPFATTARPTGTLNGAIAVTGETTIHGVSGVFAGKEGTAVNAPESSRDVTLQFVLTNAAQALMVGSPNQPYVAHTSIDTTNVDANFPNPITLVGNPADYPGLPLGNHAGTVHIVDSTGTDVTASVPFVFFLTGEVATGYSPTITLDVDGTGSNIVLTGSGVTF